MDVKRPKLHRKTLGKPSEAEASAGKPTRSSHSPHALSPCTLLCTLPTLSHSSHSSYIYIYSKSSSTPSHALFPLLYIYIYIVIYIYIYIRPTLPALALPSRSSHSSFPLDPLFPRSSHSSHSPTLPMHSPPLPEFPCTRSSHSSHMHSPTLPLFHSPTELCMHALFPACTRSSHALCYSSSHPSTLPTKIFPFFHSSHSSHSFHSIFPCTRSLPTLPLLRSSLPMALARNSHLLRSSSQCMHAPPGSYFGPHAGCTGAALTIAVHIDESIDSRVDIYTMAAATAGDRVECTEGHMQHYLSESKHVHI